LRCVGYLNAPEYQPGDAATTSYCNSECQIQHRSQHKARCRTLSQRIKLLQAGRISKAALLAYRQVFFDIDLQKIEQLNGVLCLHQRQRSMFKSARIVQFPEHLTNNVEYREAALLNNQ
jgi:hypothetical protein